MILVVVTAAAVAAAAASITAMLVTLRRLRRLRRDYRASVEAMLADAAERRSGYRRLIDESDRMADAVRHLNEELVLIRRAGGLPDRASA